MTHARGRQFCAGLITLIALALVAAVGACGTNGGTSPSSGPWRHAQLPGASIPPAALWSSLRLAVGKPGLALLGASTGLGDPHKVFAWTSADGAAWSSTSGFATGKGDDPVALVKLGTGFAAVGTGGGDVGGSGGDARKYLAAWLLSGGSSWQTATSTPSMSYVGPGKGRRSVFVYDAVAGARV